MGNEIGIQGELSKLSAGLDALETRTTTRRSWSKSLLNYLAPGLGIILILLIWQSIVVLKLQPDYVLPSAEQVFHSLKSQFEQDILWQSTLNSLRRAFQGFVLAILIATPIGIALGMNKILRAIFRPILTGLQQLPSVAWVPAAIIWFGLSNATIYAVLLLGAVPSIANGLTAGIDHIPKQYLKVGQVLGANRFQTIRHIVLPASWPGYLAGLEQGWAFTGRSLMAAELIAVSPALGPGLGQMLDVGRQLGDMSLVLGSIFMIMLTGVLVERLVFSPLRERTLRIRGLT
jgi:NitT/TauT family transport system permease protein